jgi:hypothetical protein
MGLRNMVEAEIRRFEARSVWKPEGMKTDMYTLIWSEVKKN